MDEMVRRSFGAACRRPHAARPGHRLPGGEFSDGVDSLDVPLTPLLQDLGDAANVCRAVKLQLLLALFLGGLIATLCQVWLLHRVWVVRRPLQGIWKTSTDLLSRRSLSGISSQRRWVVYCGSLLSHSPSLPSSSSMVSLACPVVRCRADFLASADHSLLSILLLSPLPTLPLRPN